LKASNQKERKIEGQSISTSKIAVFDVDRTLILNTSVEVQLIHFLRQRGMLPLANFIKNFMGFIRQLPHGFEQVVLRKSIYLNGLNAREVKSLLPELFETYLRPRLSQKIQEYMETLRDKGHEIILISGTLDFLLDFLVEILEADGGVGSPLEIQNGLFTGQILGIHPYYHGKVKALKKYLDGRKVDYRNSYGFGDSWADFPLLSLFGNPIVVNPGKISRRQAKKKGWKVIREG